MASAVGILTRSWRARSMRDRREINSRSAVLMRPRVAQAKFLPESTNEFGERIVSWLVNDGYCVHVDGLESDDDLECLPAWDIYAAALYW